MPGYLSWCEHSRVELRRKLVPHVEPAEEVDTLLGQLEGEGWLSNMRFAESMVYRRADYYGIAHLTQELKMHQLDKETLGEVKAQLRSTEAVRTEALWEGRFDHPSVDLTGQAKQV